VQHVVKRTDAKGPICNKYKVVIVGVFDVFSERALSAWVQIAFLLGGQSVILILEDLICFCHAQTGERHTRNCQLCAKLLLDLLAMFFLNGSIAVS